MLDVVREVGDSVLVRAIAVIGRRRVSIAGVRDPGVSNSGASVCRVVVALPGREAMGELKNRALM